jgi:phosphoglycerate dehydrogenase-like enzyme
MKKLKNSIILDPHPRTRELIFSEADFSRLQSLARIHEWREGKMPAETLEEHLPEACVVIGQTDLPRKRLESAANLKAIVNVEGNFQQNIDYPYCFERSIHILNAGIAFSQAVAEMALGFALCLDRGLVEGDNRFRAGREVYGAKSNTESFLLKNKQVGILGLGNIGRALTRLLEPFECRIRAYDPWLPANYIKDLGLIPDSLGQVLKLSKVIFVLAGATMENRAMLGLKELKLIGEDALIILLSRASVVDFEALTKLLSEGRFRAAIDVFPQEPFPKNHPLRQLNNVLLSAHRAGSLQETYKLMGEMTVDDLTLILQGLPPVRLQRADRETVARMSSKPIKG